MTHGFLEHLLTGKALVYSAGVEAHGVNPKAVQVMAEAGIDLAAHTSKGIV